MVAGPKGQNNSLSTEGMERCSFVMLQGYLAILVLQNYNAYRHSSPFHQQNYFRGELSSQGEFGVFRGSFWGSTTYTAVWSLTTFLLPNPPPHLSSPCSTNQLIRCLAEMDSHAIPVAGRAAADWWSWANQWLGLVKLGSWATAGQQSCNWLLQGLMKW